MGNGRKLLSAYIGHDRGARAAFARKAKISEPQLSLFLSGRRRFSIPVARRVSDATNGKVPFTSLLSAELANAIEDAA